MVRMWFVPSNRGFYNDDVYDVETVPIDAIEIDEDQYAALLKGQAEGKEIVADEMGAPTLRERPIDLEIRTQDARRRRNQLLTESDWVELPSAARRLSAEQIELWENYRQALRDLPEAEGWPLTPAFPKIPS